MITIFLISEIVHSLVESVPSIKFISVYQLHDSLNLCSQGAYSVVEEVKILLQKLR